MTFSKKNKLNYFLTKIHFHYILTNVHRIMKEQTKQAPIVRRKEKKTWIANIIFFYFVDTEDESGKYLCEQGKWSRGRVELVRPGFYAFIGSMADVTDDEAGRRQLACSPRFRLPIHRMQAGCHCREVICKRWGLEWICVSVGLTEVTMVTSWSWRVSTAGPFQTNMSQVFMRSFLKSEY